MYTRNLALIFCWTLVVLFTSCSTDPTSSIPDSIESPSDPTSSIPGSIESPSCADKRLDGVPSQVGGATVAIEDRVESAPCADGAATGSQNLVTFFVAPQDGDYRFSTLGSNFDTILHARTNSCSGEVLACNDDHDAKTSELTLNLVAGQTLVLVVEGFNRASGNVTLRVEGREEVCDDGLDGDGDGVSDCADMDCLLLCENPLDWPPDWAAFEQQGLSETNRVRAAGATCAQDELPPAGPLEINRFLRYSSRLHARDMGLKNYFDHLSLDGRTPDERMRQANFEGNYPTGENIAAGQGSAIEVVEGWMKSPGHCRNIMNPDYHVIGVGYAFVEDSEYRHFWVQNFAGSH